MNRPICAALFAAALVACSAEPPTPAPQPTPRVETPALAQPNVVMNADPPPPFTYWAPEGSIISNHPDVPGIWFADLNGERVGTYFGDACRASQAQRWVGQPLQSLPPPAADEERRISCTTCPVNADLRPTRTNVLFNEETQTVEAVACY